MKNLYLQRTKTEAERFFDALQDINKPAEEILMEESDRSAKDYADQGEDLGAEEIRNDNENL